MHRALADVAEELTHIAWHLRQVLPTIELGHDDGVTMREIHEGVTKYAQQIEELSRRTRV